PKLTRHTAMVLYAVSRGVRHGFDIIDATGLPSGTVYPILRRLEEGGLLRSDWEAVRIAREEQRPPRRYYQVTGPGTAFAREALERFPDISTELAGVPALKPRRA
ncbi:MAG TPA: PadR family transcriptional regulator, partial [Gemmatimonadales bacterium]|nr:PadR family transcriptional regulator [Gemmatimonadales bacterium]